MANYDERILLVEVAGIRQQGVMQTDHATFKVPYCSLSRSLQLIKLKGGRIVRIHPLASSLMTETVDAPLPKTVEAPLPETAESPPPLTVESEVPKQTRLPGLLRRLLGNT